MALPVLHGAETALAEQTVPLRLQRSVINGLRLGDLAVGPVSYTHLDVYKRQGFTMNTYMHGTDSMQENVANTMGNLLGGNVANS